MADVSRLLNEASGRAEQTRKRLESDEATNKETFSPAEDAAKKQAKQNWLTSTITEEMFLSIGSQSKQLIDAALDAASNVTDEEGRMKIVHMLIKAKTLREVINTYTK